MIHRPSMSIARLQQLLDAWGGNPARWPADERDAALALCAQEPRALQLQREALELDVALAALPAPAAPPAWLAARVLARVPVRPDSFWRWLGGWPMLAPTAALALAGGIALGLQLGPIDSADQPSDEWLALAGLAEAWNGDFEETQ